VRRSLRIAVTREELVTLLMALEDVVETYPTEPEFHKDESALHERLTVVLRRHDRPRTSA
jgi:hypothetical protein